MDAMTHLFQLRDPESFRGWLYKIARGKLAKWFKDRKRHAIYSILDDVSTDSEVDIGYVVPIAAHEQPENLVIVRERLDIVLNFINQLPMHRGLKTLEAELESKYRGEFTDMFR